jgi:hypothetical protein
MSGGSMGYLYYKVAEASFDDHKTPERRAFRAHLQKVAAALKAIEWNDSGDGAENEEELILACIGSQALLESVVEEARERVAVLNAAIKRAQKEAS